MNIDFYLFQIINPVKDIFSFVVSIDILIFNEVNNWAGQYIWLDALGIFFAKYFGYILVFCLFLFLVYPVKSREAGPSPLQKGWVFNRVNFKKYLPMIAQAIFASILSRLFFTEIVRWIFPKDRPFIENDVNLLLNHAPTSAFPSGHAAFYFAISSVVYFYNKKAGIMFFLASFLISISRVFCGIHWPLDILAGAIVGIFSGLLIVKIFKINLKIWQKK